MGIVEALTKCLGWHQPFEAMMLLELLVAGYSTLLALSLDRAPQTELQNVSESTHVIREVAGMKKLDRKGHGLRL